MSWVTPINWLAKAIRYKVTRADMQTISDDLNALGDTDGRSLTAPGWVDSSNPWVYVSANSFKVVGIDVTKRYSVGTKLSYMDVTAKSAYAGTATYAGGDTTVPIIAGTGNTLSGGVITNPRYSYASTPQGFPGVFAYASLYEGWVATPTMQLAFSIQGRLMTVWIWISGTSNATSAAVNLPIATSASFPACAGGAMYIPCRIGNNGGWSATPGAAKVAANSNRVDFYSDMASSAFAAANAKIVGATLVVPI